MSRTPCEKRQVTRPPRHDDRRADDTSAVVELAGTHARLRRCDRQLGEELSPNTRGPARAEGEFGRGVEHRIADIGGVSARQGDEPAIGERGRRAAAIVGRSADPMIRIQAVAVGESYLEEALLKPFLDPATLTRCPASPGGARDNFNNVCDYAGYNASAVTLPNASTATLTAASHCSASVTSRWT